MCVCVYVCVCVCITQAHIACGLLRCEAKGRDETPGEPEESRSTKSVHTCIRSCVRSIYAKPATG